MRNKVHQYNFWGNTKGKVSSTAAPNVGQGLSLWERAVSSRHNTVPNLSNIQACEAAHLLQSFFRRWHCLARKQESNCFFTLHKPDVLTDSYCLAEKQQQLIPEEFSAQQGLREAGSCRNRRALSPAGTTTSSCWVQNKGQKLLPLICTAVQQDFASKGPIVLVKRQDAQSAGRNTADFPFWAPYAEYL